MQRIVLGLGFALCIGCGSDAASGVVALDGGGEPAESALVGAVDGRAFVVRDAVVAVTQKWKSSLYPGSSTVIVLTDSTGLCSQMTSNVTTPSTQQLILDLGEVTSGTAAPITGPGTFPWSETLASPRTSQVFYSFIDDVCGFHKDFGSAGAVTITDFGSGSTSAAGSVDVTLGGGSLRGAFVAHGGCTTDVVDTYLNRTPVCQ